ncbi:DUF924 domain-containing protein [Halomonas sp. MCCC 1A17488]|uniref:DUF924 domain-containing protein n=1 Tax=Billgrantia sulfidoxydans TaxID=2733484 RepID=A0ABX7W201_9GAMM|nr:MULTISPECIES: DUF924 family protein [Halomonas]MCE8015862.1 DUF924 domain-containing protein [Halomonas sp. MCCC 1A17488]MCG3239195.1 DUF924 domain-containing protein [Halomonas sp. MCCC 1A17488]QPP50869.1 DUF924 domain-containing protein [Halomonas sp. SS10-MC5]QTP54394.1 DUF924 domain-containing protein [Halomonas sulfidoxydans]
MDARLPDRDAVIAFWFEELEPAQWFRKDAGLDGTIRDRFAALHDAAAAGELWQWRDTPRGRLAEILVLDQFSRNLFRDDSRAFAQDAMALVLAQEAVAQGCDRELEVGWRRFFYMPYMHSESLAIHGEALRLFDQPGLEDNLRYEHLHRDILLRFGRYPHRNAILGRESSEEELAFLEQPGSSF